MGARVIERLACEFMHSLGDWLYVMTTIKRVTLLLPFGNLNIIRLVSDEGEYIFVLLSVIYLLFSLLLRVLSMKIYQVYVCQLKGDDRELVS